MTDTTAAVAGRPVPAAPAHGRRRSVLWRISNYGILGAFILLFIVLAVSSSQFLTVSNLLNLLDQNAAIGIVACAATLVIIGGGFDLSVGAVFAMAGVIAAEAAASMPPGLALAAGVITGLVLGVINGFIVTVGRVHSFIATLATSIIIGGLALIITNGFLVDVADPGFSDVGRGMVGQVSYAVIIWAAFAVFCTVLLSRSAFGRHVYAAGGNPEAARFSGVAVGRVRAVTFALSGLAAGIAGVIVASRVATGQADTGTGMELTAIAAVVVGGTSISGGEGAVWRTVLGVMFIALIGNGFNLLSIEPLYQQIVQGAIILGAVALDAWARRRR